VTTWAWFKYPAASIEFGQKPIIKREEDRMTKKLKYFYSFFVGNLVFFFLYSFITWALTFLKITPYGRFVATFFKGKTSDEAKTFIEANKELFDQLLPAATNFSNIVISPTVGLVTGIVAGLILSAKKTSVGVIWSLVTILPVTFMFWSKSAAEPYRVVYIALFLFVTAVGGFIGTKLMSEKIAEG